MRRAWRRIKVFDQPAIRKLFFTGVVILFLATALHLPPRWESTLEHLGLLFVTTAVITPLLNEGFEKWVKRAFAIVRDAANAGVDRIFACRNKETVSEITTQTQRATEHIDLLVIAGTSFFRQPGEGEETMLTEFERRCRTNSPLKVRLLLLDPRSRFACERSDREDEEPYKYPNNQLCRDILNAVSQIEAILSACEKRDSEFRIEARLYNEEPTLFYVRVDHRVFFESYSKGIPADQQDRLATKCLGKSVPVLQTKIESETGHICQSHFEYVWEQAAHAVIVPGTHQCLSATLKDDDWYEFHWKRKEEERNRMRIGKTPLAPATPASSLQTIPINSPS